MEIIQKNADGHEVRVAIEGNALVMREYLMIKGRPTCWREGDEYKFNRRMTSSHVIYARPLLELLRGQIGARNTNAPSFLPIPKCLFPQEPLGAEFAKVLSENLWELYE